MIDRVQVTGVPDGTLPMLVVELYDEECSSTIVRPVDTKDSRSVCLKAESQEVRQRTMAIGRNTQRGKGRGRQGVLGNRAAAYSLSFGPTDFCMPIVTLFFVLAVNIYYNCIYCVNNSCNF
jgi:hypothetical protein